MIIGKGASLRYFNSSRKDIQYISKITWDLYSMENFEAKFSIYFKNGLSMTINQIGPVKDIESHNGYKSIKPQILELYYIHKYLVQRNILDNLILKLIVKIKKLDLNKVTFYKNK